MAQVATYPEDEQKERWRRNADRLGLSMAEYVEMMVEAGNKNFTARTDRDETSEELRQQRNELRAEVRRLRGRVETLEDRLYGGEREEIITFIEANEPAPESEIVSRMVETANRRVPSILDSFEADGYVSYTRNGYVRNETDLGVSK